MEDINFQFTRYSKLQKTFCTYKLEKSYENLRLILYTICVLTIRDNEATAQNENLVSTSPHLSPTNEPSSCCKF